LNVDDIMQWLRVHRSNIPIKYLGLPLSTLSLKTIDVQSPMDKVGPKLFSLAWKIYQCSLNEQVVWSSVTSQVIYHTTQLVIPCSFFNPSKFREGILFGVVDKVYRAKCKVNWQIVCTYKEKGGLSIINIDNFVCALCLRWP
jgi:hypothetical protein